MTIEWGAGGRIPPAPKAWMYACLAALTVAAPAAPASAQLGYGLEAAIKSSARGDLKAFYKLRGNQPLWLRGGMVGPEAARLVELIETADLDGLDPGDYDPDDLREALLEAQQGTPKAVARAEMLLSRTFIEYVRDSRRVPAATMVYVDRELAPAPPQPRVVLEAAAVAPSLLSHLDNMGWMNPLYAQLRRGLAAHRSQWGNLPQMSIPPGPPLKTGATGERVRMLRSRLGLAPEGGFGRPLAARLRAFQASYGLPQDAVAGAKTIAALNEGAGRQEQLIRLNLARARALPAGTGRYIIVDAASARLWAYENGRVVDSMRVVVGKPTEQTPMMAGYIRHAMVNPYWNMPPDLVRRRIAPAVLSKGVSYVKANGYEVLTDWSEQPRLVDPARVNWNAVATGAQDLPVRQLPGRDNAMGKMKFMLPNKLGIYLHDTPEKNLFQKAERRFSSGCVRVEDAPRLARWLFGRPLKVPAGGSEQQVNLPQPVPVYITYLTAAPAAQGIAFRSDAYNRDQSQLAKLGGRSFAGR